MPLEGEQKALIHKKKALLSHQHFMSANATTTQEFKEDIRHDE